MNYEHENLFKKTISELQPGESYVYLKTQIDCVAGSDLSQYNDEERADIISRHEYCKIKYAIVRLAHPYQRWTMDGILSLSFATLDDAIQYVHRVWPGLNIKIMRPVE